MVLSNHFTLAMGDANGGQGIGDSLQGLLAVKGVEYHIGASVRYHVAKQTIPWVRLFHDNVSPLPAPPDAKQLNLGYDIELQTCAAVPRWVRYCRNTGIDGVEPVIPHALITNPERLLTANRYQGHVAIVPWSVHPTRNWQERSWQSVEKMLGCKTVILTDRMNKHRSRCFAGEVVIGAAPEIVCSILMNVDAVIGVDTGLMHLAGMLGKRCVCVCAATDADAIYGCYPDVRGVSGKLHCNNCWFQGRRGYSSDCNRACQAIMTVDPAEVVAGVLG